MLELWLCACLRTCACVREMDGQREREKERETHLSTVAGDRIRRTDMWREREGRPTVTVFIRFI